MLKKYRLTFLTVISLALFLAACSNEKAAPPKPPTIELLTPTAALPGETITVSGLEFSDEGSIAIGEVSATTSSWGPTEVILVVPEGVLAGPQELTLTTAHGSASTELFVGVDFVSGTLDQLEEMALPKGTAVRLGRGTFSSDAEMVVLNNLSLHGSDKDETLLGLTDEYGILALLADDDRHLSVSNLTIEAFATAVIPEPFGEIQLLSAGPTTTGRLADALRTQVLEGNLSALWEQQGMRVQESRLLPQAASKGSFVLRDVDLTLPGDDGVPLMTMVYSDEPALIYAGDLSLERVSITPSEAVLYVLSGGDLTITDSAISANFFGIGSMFGGLSITASDFVLGEDESDGFLVAPSGMVIQESTFVSEDGTIEIFTNFDETETAVRNTLTLTDNRFSLQSKGPNRGEFGIGMTATEADISGNEIIAEGGVFVYGSSGELRLRDNDMTIGSPGAAAPLVLEGSGRHRVTVEENAVAFQGGAGIEIIGAPSITAVVRHNTVTGDGGTALLGVKEDRPFASGEFYLTAEDNVFSGFYQALYFEMGSDRSGLYEVKVNHNHFDFDIYESPQTATLNNLPFDTEVDATNNIWGMNTDAAIVSSYVEVFGGMVTADALLVDPIKLP